MRPIKIITDSSSDLTLEQYKNLGIDFLPFTISFDNQKEYHELVDLTVSNFYRLLAVEPNAKTAMVTPQMFIDKFRLYLEQGFDIICLTISSKFSGTHESAVAAKLNLQDEFSEAKIHVVDSLNVTAGLNQIVHECHKMVVAGLEIDHILEKLFKIIESSTITFTVDSLEYLQRGGRIGKGSALLGTVLNIKPVLRVSEGEIKPYSKIRGRKKAIDEVMQVHFKEIDKYDDYEFAFLHSECVYEATELLKATKDAFGVSSDLPIVFVGATIGVHIGPSAIGISSCKKYTRV